MAPRVLERPSGGRGCIDGAFASELAAWWAGLTLPDGAPFEVMPWERDFADLVATGAPEISISMARGNGKSAIVGALAAAVVSPGGPLHHRSASVIVVASSLKQASIVFGDVIDFLFPEGEPDRREWRLQRSTVAHRLEHVASRARVEALGSDPRRAHGLRPSLVIADEPAQWPPATGDRMAAAIRTSLGKRPGSRLVVLGTRPASPDHWFQRLLDDPDIPGLVYAADPEADPLDREAWKAANPSLPWMPFLEAAIAREAKAAARDSALLPQFRAFRNNAGVSDVGDRVLLDSGTWKRIETDDASTDGRPILGLDLGSGAAMTAGAAVWPSGRAETLAAFPRRPSLAERGLQDGVADRYAAMAGAGDLVLAGDFVTDIPAFLGLCIQRWGQPAAIVCDQWRINELRQALVASPVAVVPLIVRRMGPRDGGEDVRRFRSVAMSGRLKPVASMLTRQALAEARTQGDASGNEWIATGSTSGRRKRGRDDAACALVLAAAEFDRRPPQRRAWRSGGVAR